MIIPDHSIRGFEESSRPVIIFRNEDGTFASGFVLRDDEYVTSERMTREAIKAAGLPMVEITESSF
ncbi:hypothetical protein GWD52_12270 [Enterobacteriaceae bacterium 4M9]|nr:hypothetical protein [Enterobacteriaceae bacterium 4M9]